MRIMGVDCSTNSLAWGLIEDGVLVNYGEYFFAGSDVYKRMVDARRKTEALAADGLFDVDFVVFEQAVMVKSVAVAIKMASVFGVVMSIILERGGKVVEVQPMVWQEHIGNPVLRGKARTSLLSSHPELKTKSQSDTFIRNYRKKLTADWVETAYDVVAANDNVSDAIAIASFGWDRLKRA